MNIRWNISVYGFQSKPTNFKFHQASERTTKYIWYSKIVHVSCTIIYYYNNKIFKTTKSKRNLKEYYVSSCTLFRSKNLFWWKKFRSPAQYLEFDKFDRILLIISFWITWIFWIKVLSIFVLVVTEIIIRNLEQKWLVQYSLESFLWFCDESCFN